MDSRSAEPIAASIAAIIGDYANQTVYIGGKVRTSRLKRYHLSERCGQMKAPKPVTLSSAADKNLLLCRGCAKKPPVEGPSKPGHKRTHYSLDHKMRAVNYVMDKGYTITEAASVFEVHRRTLGDWVKYISNHNEEDFKEVRCKLCTM